MGSLFGGGKPKVQAPVVVKETPDERDPISDEKRRRGVITRGLLLSGGALGDTTQANTTRKLLFGQ